MTDVIIYGPPLSSYVRTALMVCAYKEIPHRLQPIEMGGSEHLELHPFGKVPVMSYGCVRLFETLAITYFLDATFEEKPLLAGTREQRASTLQWMSAINDVIYRNLILRCVVERFVKPMHGQAPDEAAIADAAPAIRANLDVLDATLDGVSYLAGGRISLADFFLAPIIHYFAATPEGAAELPSRENIQRWRREMQKAPAFESINALG